MERQKHNIAGESGFYHFYGVVEDRNDPLKAGRVRVRIFGKHSENVSDIPTDALPWSQVILPLNATPNSMISLADGQLVFGFYADGVEQQVPVILGQLVVDGNSVNDLEGEKQTGFQDMRAQKQVKRHDNTDFANGINNSKNAGILGPQTNLRESQKTTVNNKLFSFQESPDSFAGEYPWIKSIETESGHLIEFDDTPGNERLYIWHRKGQYIELTKTGDVNIKVINDNKRVTGNNDFDIVIKDKNIHVGGNLNIHVNQNANINVAGNVDLSVGGNMDTDVSGNYNIKAGGQFVVNASTIRLN